jgi:hypothetical protein
VYKTSATVAALVVMLALSGFVSAATAATAGWMVNGSLLTGTKALTTTAATDEEFALQVGSLFTIECQDASIKPTLPEITAPNRLVLKGYEMTQCSLANEEGACHLGGSKVVVGSLLAEATLDGTLGVRAVFKPETGSALFSWEIVGVECIADGKDSLGGQATMLAPSGQDERTLQLLKWATTTGEIKPEPTNVKGSELLRLASGEAWSFL